MSSKLPFVSIGISFFNAESSLLDAIRSVFVQTHQNWELILVDDGSTDRSLEIAQSIDDPRVRVYSDGENKKLAARLNQIIDLSKYEFIVRMDADDLMAPDRIEKQLKILVENNDIDLVSTGVLSLNDNDEPVGVRLVSQEHKLTAKKLLYGQSGIVHASVVARKTWYQRNYYREDYPAAEDSELWIRAYSSSDLKVFFVREPLYFYREDGNVTKEKVLRGYRLGRRMIKKSARNRFPIALKINSYTRSILKTLFVLGLDFFGKFDFLRKRRNSTVPSVEQTNSFYKALSYIEGFDILIK